MYSIRAATPADIPVILDLIRSLAAYERDPDAVKTTEADLLRDGFGEQPCFECLIAENGEGEERGQPAGFALYFYNYSTWRGRSGIHLEDLFVLPRFRGQGIGKALLARVAARAAERGCRPSAMGRSGSGTRRLSTSTRAWARSFSTSGASCASADEGIRSLAALATASEPAR